MGKLIAIAIVCFGIYLGWKGVTSFIVDNNIEKKAVTISVDKAKAHEVAAKTKATAGKTYEVSKNVAEKSGKIFNAVSTIVNN